MSPPLIWAFYDFLGNSSKIMVKCWDSKAFHAVKMPHIFTPKPWTTPKDLPFAWKLIARIFISIINWIVYNGNTKYYG